jgi:hypothetical protein
LVLLKRSLPQPVHILGKNNREKSFKYGKGFMGRALRLRGNLQQENTTALMEKKDGRY